MAGGAEGALANVCSFRKAFLGKMSGIATRRLDYVRGFHGSHVRDYVRATEPSFVVGEFWDSLTYSGSLPDHNQVLALVSASHPSTNTQVARIVETGVVHPFMRAEPISSTIILSHDSHAVCTAAALVLSIPACESA